METFRVAVSGDFLNTDQTSAFPDFDLSPLDNDPNIEYTYLPNHEIVRAEDMAGFDALILLAARFERDSFPSGGKLSLIARFGVGYDTVDVQACTDRNVALVITPDGVRRPVAVVILTLILALAGRLLQKDRIARLGPAGWATKSQFLGTGLVGRTLGSVGVGNIGAEMFRLAKPFGMKPIAHDPYVDPEIPKSLGIQMVDLDTVFRESDFVTVNCPLSEQTKHLVSEKQLALMKPTAFFINTARGPIVNQEALYDALSSGRIAGAGLDVFAEEPIAADDPLLKLDNVIATPHGLCLTDQCIGGIGAADVEAVFSVMHGREPVGIVNREIRDDRAWREKLNGYRELFGSG